MSGSREGAQPGTAFHVLSPAVAPGPPSTLQPGWGAPIAQRASGVCAAAWLARARGGGGLSFQRPGACGSVGNRLHASSRLFLSVTEETAYIVVTF